MSDKLNSTQKARVLGIAYLDGQLRKVKSETSLSKFNQAIYRKFIYFSLFLSEMELTQQAEQYAKDCDLLMSISAEEIGD